MSENYIANTQLLNIILCHELGDSKGGSYCGLSTLHQNRAFLPRLKAWGCMETGAVCQLSSISPQARHPDKASTDHGNAGQSLLPLWTF